MLSRAVRSVREQTYPHCYLIIGSDTPDDLPHIEALEPDDIVTYEPIFGSFPPEAYMNILQDHVTEGWIMCLDDDDMLATPRAAERIMAHSLDEETLIVWRSQIGEAVQPPDDLWRRRVIQSSFIGSFNFSFHLSQRRFARWFPRVGGDYEVVSSLYDNLPKSTWIDEILTRTQTTPGRGKRLDLPASEKSEPI